MHEGVDSGVAQEVEQRRPFPGQMRREALNVGESAGAGQSSGETGGQGFDGFVEAVARQPARTGVIAQA